MESAFRSFLVFFCIWTLSLKGSAQELPFIYFPKNALSPGEMLAFQQNSNKELLFANKEGLFLFDSKATRELFSFSPEQSSGLEQLLFTSEGLITLSGGKVMWRNLQGEEIRTVKKGGIEKLFYYPEREQVFMNSESKLELLKENGEVEKVLEGVGDIRFLEFGELENFLIGARSIKVYSKDWYLQEEIAMEKPVLDSDYQSGRLLLLTADAVLSKEGRAAFKERPLTTGLQPSCLLEDQSGRTWVGTAGKGIVLLDGNQQKVLSDENNFPLKEVQGIYESPDLSLWFYGKEGLVYKSLSAPFQKFKAGRHFSGEVLQDIAQTADGFAVLTKEGHYHHLLNEKIAESEYLSLPFEPDFSRITGKGSTIHVSKDGNVLLRRGNRSTHHTLEKAIVQLFTFAQHSLIVAQDGAVFLLDHETQAIRQEKWGVSTGKPLVRSGKYLLYVDDNSKIKKWDSESEDHQLVGNYKADMLLGGLFQNRHFIYLSGDRQLKFAFKEAAGQLDFSLGKAEMPLHLFISDADLWLSTEETLYQLGLNLVGDTLKIVETKAFSSRDFDLQLPVFKSLDYEEGSYWLVSENNLLLYNSFALLPDVSAPGLVLDQLFIQSRDSVSRVAVSDTDTIEVKLKQGEDLLLKAHAVNFDPKNSSSLKYRFKNKENRWKAPMEEGIILFSGLGPGHHLVELIAENKQGVISEKSISLLLEVEKPLWYKWWVWLGASLSFMLVGFIAYSGIKSAKDSKSREAREKYEKELLKLQKRGHEQMMKADGLRQVNELISAQKAELEDKNKQIIAQKYELSLTNNQIKQQKDLIEKTSEKLQNSINYAQRIQTALMADEIQIKEALADSFVFFKPRDQVSGDFFWFEKTKNQEGEELLVIAAVDCTGHGVPGAIVSVVGIQLLNAIVKAKGITDPGSILNELNADLLNSLKYEQTRMNDGMDMSLCTLNLEKKKLYFAGAKNPLYIVAQGELEIIKGDKYPIGGQKLKEEKVFTTHEIDFKGDGSQMFYLFSDGYQDQFGGADNSKFLTKNFKKLLLELSEQEMMEQKYQLGKTIKDWQGGHNQTDDILVMGFKL